MIVTVSREMARILGRMTELAVGPYPWQRVGLRVIMLNRLAETPAFAPWDYPTFTERLYVGFDGNKATLGHHPRPWLPAEVTQEPYWWVERLLTAKNPWRELAIREEVKAARRRGRAS